MLLRQPSYARYVAVMTLAWTLLVLCLALEVYSSWTQAESPALGGQIQASGAAAIVTGLDAHGALARSGIRVGDRLLTIAGRPVNAAVVTDPDSSFSWSDRDQVYEWQRFLTDASRGGTLPMVFATSSGERALLCSLRPLGWREAARRSWAMRLVGWGFLLPALLIWIKKQSEASLSNLLLGLCGFVVFSTISGYTERDLWMPVAALQTLSLIHYLFANASILLLHAALVFPSPLSWLKRVPWVRIIPWCLYALQLFLHYGRIYSSPEPSVCLLGMISLLAFVANVVLRFYFCRDSLERAQLRWIALGFLAGFLPWFLLSGIPDALHQSSVPFRYTLLPLVAVPISVSFAVLRYRLLDVDWIYDWVVAHTVILSLFTCSELLFWNWLSAHYAAQAAAKPLLLSLSICVVLFLYAPLRTWGLNLLKKLHGRWRPALAESLHRLLARTQATEDPRAALEETLQWALNPSEIAWILPGQEYDALLYQLKSARQGLLGYELGELCPPRMQAAAWVPIQIEEKTAALVLYPYGSRSWNRHELRIAGTLAKAGEPLLEMQRMQLVHRQTQAAMREQRDELLREMHDGLGSELFGASLLSDISGPMSEAELRKRMVDVRAALANAMDSLRAGLTVLSTSPGAFGPAVLALLLRAERVFAAAGIALQTQIDDETLSLQLDSPSVFGLLRALQEALTNIVRHSHASCALVRLAWQGHALAILVQDDGVGFLQASSRAGHGLANMQRRLQMLSGSIAVHSSLGHGCSIELLLPLRKENR
jgi:signal transduction histidine kinase